MPQGYKLGRKTIMTRLMPLGHHPSTRLMPLRHKVSVYGSKEVVNLDKKIFFRNISNVEILFIFWLVSKENTQRFQIKNEKKWQIPKKAFYF